MKQSAIRWTLVAIIGVLLLALGLILFSPIVLVSGISVYRTEARLDIEQVQQDLAPLFGRHLFFLSISEVKDLLHHNLPDVKEIKVQKEYPSKVLVHVSLEPLVAKLKIISPDADNSGTGTTVDYLTENGKYTATMSPGEVDTLPTIRVVDWATYPVPGAQIMTPDFLEGMTRAARALEVQFGHTIVERTVFLRARELHLKTDAYTLWMDMTVPLEDQLIRYRTFLQAIDPGEVQEYIDLRLSDRVIYK